MSPEVLLAKTQIWGKNAFFYLFKETYISRPTLLRNVAKQSIWKNVEHTSFLILGYNIFELIGTNTDDVPDSQSSSEKRKAHERIFALKSNGDQNTSQWKLSKLLNVCAISLKDSVFWERETFVNNLFFIQAARVLFKTFWEAEPEEGVYGSFLSVIRFDVVS